jgi:RimJ/RimL family protein N-acetyltransferase
MSAIFETERLLVRPWTLDDVEEAFAIYGDAEVSTFLSWTARSRAWKRSAKAWRA